VQIQKLNKKYRFKDRPTNVLSFPQDAQFWINDHHDLKKIVKNKTLQDPPVLLGDIVLAFETIQQEAIEQQKKIDHHITHLTIHSVLHLLGYDHETEDEAYQMEQLEINLLEKMNIENPYIEKNT
jgi:probable rRNA maturation factor